MLRSVLISLLAYYFSSSLSLGGRGLPSPHRFDPTGVSLVTDEAPASHHDAAFYGSWSACWYYMCAWGPLLSPDLYDTPDPASPRFMHQISLALSMISKSLTSLKAHRPRQDLPSHIELPRGARRSTSAS